MTTRRKYVSRSATLRERLDFYSVVTDTGCREWTGSTDCFAHGRASKRTAIRRLHSSDDPGNPGQRIALYDVPQQIYGVPVRVLLCTNGSPESSGERHRFGLTCPASIDNAVSAAAWTYSLTAEEYAGMERRT